MMKRLFLPLLLGLSFAIPAHAQDNDPIVTATQALDKAANDYQAIDAAFDNSGSTADRQELHDRAEGVKQASAAQVDALTTQLQLIDARIGQLGPVTPGVVEAPDIRAQRKLLAQQRSTVDSAIKRGKLLGVEAEQLAGEIDDSQANAFSERMSVRVASPLSPGFWLSVLHTFPRDSRRIAIFVGAEANAIRAGVGQGGLVSALFGLVVALLLVFPVRRVLGSAGRRYVIEHVPGNRVRRSGLALWLTLVGALVPGFAAMALVAGLRGGGMLAPEWEGLARIFQRVAFIAALITALGGALLQTRQSSWRLLPVSDETAHGLRPWTFAAAGVTTTSVLLIALRSAVNASGPAMAAAEAAIAFLYIALILGILVAAGRMRARIMRADEDRRADQSVVAFLSLLSWAVIAFAAVALVTGYVSLAYFLGRTMVWVCVVVSALYLALVATDDIIMSLFDRDGRLAEALHHGFGVRRSLTDQLGVALSAVLRLGLIVLAAGLALFPFGSNVTTLFGQLGAIAQGVTIGSITVSPGAILRAAAVLALGLFLVRVTQHWLTERYLPATELDAGARNSIAMVARYTGLILAVLWALASLGIGVERIALLLSALSVGIGFGLQAITQNFVSGLILLAERPVKIGDWVRIGDQEGDVKKISVRATEIQIADRSTLIVPNSELITKSIVNKTLADPLGRIQLQFSVPMGTDVAQVREMVMAIYKAQPSVLDDPAPSLFIDTIADGRINFNGFAFVSSPRAVYGARSDIWFRLLHELPEAGIELGTTPQQVQWIGTPPTGAEGIIGEEDEQAS